VRINKKIFKIFSVLFILTTFAQVFTPSIFGTIAYAVEDGPADDGSPGSTSKYIDDVLPSQVENAKKQITSDPRAAAQAVVQLITDPNGLTYEQKAMVSALKSASTDTMKAIKNTGIVTAEVMKQFLTTPEKKAAIQQVMRNTGNLFENVAKLYDVSQRKDDESNVANGLTNTYDVKQSALYQTLLPSIYYSKAKANKSAGSVNVSLDEVSHYGTNDGSNKNARYGFVTRQKDRQMIGTQLSNYLKALYEYDYLVVMSKSDTDTDIISRIGQFFKNVADSITGTGYTPMGTALGIAQMFGSIYDASTKFLRFLMNGITSIDWGIVLGLSGGKMDESSFIGGMVHWIAKQIGFSDGLSTALQVFFFSVLAFSFIIFIMAAMGRRNRSRMMKLITNMAVRLVVIFIFVPSSSILIGVIRDAASKMTDDFTLPSRINAMYVVDTLQWAATTNLSLAPINPNGPSPVYDSYSEYEPTLANIQKLAANIQTRAKAAGFQTDETSAADLLSKVGSRTTVSVNAYIAMIESAQSTAAGSSAASVTPDKFGTAYKPDGASTDKQISMTADNAMFLSKKEASNEDGEEEASSSEKSDTAVNWVLDESTKLDIKADAPMIAEPVRWYNMSSYIYGARRADALTPQYLAYSNFINAPGTGQLKDPTTGKEASGAVLDKLIENSNIIAIMNQYAGVAQVSGSSTYAQSLSTQTVTFLLQSVYASGSLNYSGYNTVASQSGESKNTGINGNSFVRYVIPNSSQEDLITKVYSLVTIWVCAATISVYCFIWVLKGPIIKSMFTAAGSFMKAAFFGDITAAIRFLAFDAATKFSVSFAGLGAYLTLSITKGFVDSFGQSPLGQGWATVSRVPFFGEVLGAIGTIGSAMIITILMTIVLIWPVMNLHLGTRKKSGKGTRVGFLGIFIMFPYILAESLDEYLDVMHQRIYGKSKNRTFGAKLGNQMEKIDQKAQAKQFGKNVASAAAKVGLGAVTGGAATAVGGSVLGNMLGGSAGNLLNKATDLVEMPGLKKDGVIGSVKEKFGKSRESFKELRDRANLTPAQNARSLAEAQARADADTLANMSEDDKRLQEAISQVDGMHTEVASLERASNGSVSPSSNDSNKPNVTVGNASLEQFSKAISDAVKEGLGNSGAVKDGVKEGVEAAKADTSKVSGPIDSSSLRIDAEERAAVDAISDSIRAMRAAEGMPVHISDMQRNWDESAKRQALAKEAEAAETRMNELLAKRSKVDEYLERLESAYAQANANQANYASGDNADPKKAAEYATLAKDIEAKIKQASEARSAIAAQASQAMTKAQEVTVKLDKLDEVANKIDKAMYTGAKGAAVHMVSAMRDLANGTDNSAKYRDDWERRNNPRVESAQERQAKADNKRMEQHSSEMLEAINQMNKNIETLTDEQAATNDLLSARPK
jgi:hypothetical protein